MNSRAYIKGGFALASVLLGGTGQVCVAQPAGTFIPFDHLTTPGEFHIATLFGNSKVLLAGGGGESGDASAELYDPAPEVRSIHLGVPGISGQHHSAGEATLGRYGALPAAQEPASAGANVVTRVSECLADPGGIRERPAYDHRQSKQPNLLYVRRFRRDCARNLENPRIGSKWIGVNIATKRVSHMTPYRQ